MLTLGDLILDVNVQSHEPLLRLLHPIASTSDCPAARGGILYKSIYALVTLEWSWPRCANGVAMLDREVRIIRPDR